MDRLAIEQIQRNCGLVNAPLQQILKQSEAGLAVCDLPVERDRNIC